MQKLSEAANNPGEGVMISKEAILKFRRIGLV